MPLHSQTSNQILHASDADFDEVVLRSDVPVLVDFYADWCGPCQMLAPILTDLARETSDAKIVKVNVDHAPEVAGQYGVTAIPTVMVFKQGEVAAQHMGLANKSQLKALLQR